MTNRENPKVLLKKLYEESKTTTFVFDTKLNSSLKIITDRIASNKGVFTVLVTLALYKIIHPEQDIRQHKIELVNGFSGRSFDTQFVTPTLKELGLPSMAESGWLTRSLEQAYPYDENFNGKITPQQLKLSFLYVVKEIQQNDVSARRILLALLKSAYNYKINNKVVINQISSDELEISRIMCLLNEHFVYNYDTHGGSKLPVLAFYAIYKLLISQMSRYKDCTLLPLGSHTASDRTSKSAGDIEIQKNDSIFEAIEIKLDKPVTPQMLNIAYEKINKFSVSRYYILSGAEMNEDDKKEIYEIIDQIKEVHGCQVIVNGLFATLKYYLRLVSSPNDFLNLYIELVSDDSELQKCHKEKLLELVNKNK